MLASVHRLYGFLRSRPFPALVRSTTPALPQGRTPCAAFWAALNGETPRGTMDGHPGLEVVVRVLLVPENRFEAREGCGREPRASLRGSAAIIQPCTGDQDGDEEPQRVHQDRALTALHALAAVLPVFRAADLGGLDRLTLNTDRARRGFTSRGHARLFA